MDIYHSTRYASCIYVYIRPTVGIYIVIMIVKIEKVCAQHNSLYIPIYLFSLGTYV